MPNANSVIQGYFQQKFVKPFESKFSGVISDARDRLEVQVFEPGYDPNKEKIVEATDFEQKEWKQLKANLMQKDFDMGHTAGINLNYEEV